MFQGFKAFICEYKAHMVLQFRPSKEVQAAPKMSLQSFV